MDYDQWKLQGPEVCEICEDNGDEECNGHDFERDPDEEWDNRYE